MYGETPGKIAIPHSSLFACQLAHFHKKGSMLPQLLLHHVCDLKKVPHIKYIRQTDIWHQEILKVHKTNKSIHHIAAGL